MSERIQEDTAIASPSTSSFDDPAYIEKLWDEYYLRLRSVITSRARSIRRSVASESEIALSAFHSFIRGAKEGRFAQLNKQDAVWKLIKTIAIRKANDSRKLLRAGKRGGAVAIVGQSEADDDNYNCGDVKIAKSKAEPPSLELEVADLFNSLMARLPDDRHRDVLLLKLQGASVAATAECLSTTTRTVQRILKKIEENWRLELYDS